MRKFVSMLIGSIVAAGILFGGTIAQADEILDQVNEAIDMYKAGDYGGAASGLDFAAQQIRQLQAGEISQALPDALPGWKVADSETTAMSAAFFGGGITAGREYAKGDAEVGIQIVGQAPMLQAVLMMFNNPMMMSGSGMKLTRIEGQKAAVEYDKQERSGEIQIVVQNSVLVTVTGSDVSQEDLEAYAGAVDYDLIKEFASGN
jgi:hypothetical protein